MRGNDLEEIARNYARKTDSEIERIATQDAYGLRPEVFEIIENEIKKRNLDIGLMKGVIAQNKSYTAEEIKRYSEFIRDLPCPICGNEEHKLNGTISHTVTSFIVFTISESELTIACPDCLDKKNNDALTSTGLFGWWSFPSGLYKTPINIHRNIKAKEQNRIEDANEALLSFTLTNIGQLETYKEDKQKLQEIIKPKKY